MDINDRKKEVLIIFLSTISISLVLNVIASFVFNAFNKKNVTINFLLLIIITITLVLILYQVLTSYLRDRKIRITFPFSYNQSEKRFLDLPLCPSSVHARYLFNRLPKEDKDHLNDYNSPFKFFNSDMERFLDHVVQETILTIMIRYKDTSSSYFKEIKFLQMPIGIQENRHFKSNPDILSDKYSIFIPYFKNLKTFGRNNAFIQIFTQYGKISFSWDISNQSFAGYSNAFYHKLFKQHDDFHDYVVDLVLNIELNNWYLFSKRFNQFLNWVSNIELLARNNDWDSRNIDRLFIIQSEQTD
jgi:hypothetical protein